MHHASSINKCNYTLFVEIGLRDSHLIPEPTARKKPKDAELKKTVLANISSR